MKLLVTRISLVVILAALTSISRGVAGDISFFGLIKEQRFAQTNNAAPVTDTNASFSLDCFVDSNGPGLIVAATLRLPSGASRALTADGGDEFSFRESFSTSSALNATYGQGTYTLTIDSDNDFNVVQLPMPSSVYPNAPQITNYAAAQAVNSSNSFSLGWLPFSAGTAADFVELQVRDGNGNSVFRSGNLGSPGALNGTNTTVVIPSTTLFPGEIYETTLIFAKITTLDSTSVSGANGVVAFTSRTTFSLATTGQAAKVSLHPLGFSNGGFQFSFNTQPGKAYQLQFADSLTNWQNLYYTNATSSELIFTDSFGGFNSRRFYRVMVP